MKCVCLAYYKTMFDEHAKMRLVIVLFGLYFIEFEDPIVIFIMIVELKCKTARWSVLSPRFENDNYYFKNFTFEWL